MRALQGKGSVRLCLGGMKRQLRVLQLSRTPRVCPWPESLTLAEAAATPLLTCPICGKNWRTREILRRMLRAEGGLGAETWITFNRYKGEELLGDPYQLQEVGREGDGLRPFGPKARARPRTVVGSFAGL